MRLTLPHKVTTREMKAFSATCFAWAAKTADASNRQVIVSVARSWLDIANALDRRLSQGDELIGDLRVKLN